MNLIKQRAQKINKSLGQICRATGLNRQYMAKLAAGRVKNPRIDTALKIAGALRCQVEDLWPMERKSEGGKG